MKTSAVPTLWPYAIICWFVLFASALAAWTCFAMRQKTDLVGVDYYEQEVRFQSQLDRLNRTAAIRGEVLLQHDGSRREISLQLPAGHLSPPPVGQIHFYRPSNAGLDVKVPLVLDGAGRQRLGTAALRGGLWKVRVQWRQAGAEYFFEQSIVVDESNVGDELKFKIQSPKLKGSPKQKSQKGPAARGTTCTSCLLAFAMGSASGGGVFGGWSLVL